jgi:hypothetical protein
MTRARDLADSADKDIAGTLTLDGLTVDGDIIQSGGDEIQNSGTLRLSGDYDASGAGDVEFKSKGLLRQKIANGGSISFYEDTGTTAKLFWDASAESLGIGTSSPVYPLVVQAANPRLQLLGTGTNAGISGLLFGDADTATRGQINYNHSSDSLDVVVNGSERMRITSSGNVGINNASPTVSLDVSGTGRFLKTDNDSNVILETTDDDTGAGPLLDLFRNSATPADADNLGNIRFRGVNDAAEGLSYAQIRAEIIDASAGSMDGRLSLRVQRNGSVEDKITCNSDGVIINNVASDTDFQVKSGSLNNMIFMNAANSSLGVGNNSPISGTSPRMYVHNDSTGVAIETYRDIATATSVVQAWHSNVGGTYTKTAEVEANGDFENATNSYTGLSDQRLKQDIVDATSQWDDIKALQVRKYRFINHVETMGDDATVQLGVIAQELEASGMNGLVKTKPVDEADPDGPDRKSVKYSVLYMKAIKALQEAMTKIETLETKVAALEAE